MAGLEACNLIKRACDPADGRRIVLSVSTAGRDWLESRRDARTERLAHALAGFEAEEVELLSAAAVLLERLASEL
jgi:DNA-binding MarR family transcriptional regulator